MSIPSVDRSPVWRLQGADAYSRGAYGAAGTAGTAGASDASAGRAPRAVNPVEPAQSVEKVGDAAAKVNAQEPNKPSVADAPNRDWTIPQTEKEKEPPPPPPPEPIYKQLLDLLQSVWRASGGAVDVANEIQKMTLQERMAEQSRQEPLTYSDIKIQVRRNSSL